MPKLVTRMPNGVTNAGTSQTLSAAGFLDPSWAVCDFDDFLAYDSALYTTSVVGTGALTAVAAAGGAAVSTTSSGLADAVYNQRVTAAFQLTAGKDAFFKFSGQLSDVVNSVFYAGLIATSATPLAASDGLYLTKASGAATLSLVHKVGGTTTTVALPATLTLANATPFELGLHVDSTGTIDVFFNPTTGANAINGLAGATRGPVAKLTGVTLTTALLTPSWGILNTTAAVRSVTADYILSAVNR